jgi:O-antigen/teichoic acid export membrane protein
MVGSFWSVNLSLGMKQKISGFSSMGAALLNILLNWLLIPPWGIIGAALSTLFAFSLQFGIDFWFGRKILTLHIPLDFIKKSLISSAAMSVVGLFGVSWAMESKLNLILLVISCSAVYFISLSCLKAFHFRELSFSKEA